MIKETTENREEIINLYDLYREIPVQKYPIVTPKNHTMGKSIKKYIRDKLSLVQKTLDRIVECRFQIEIHGIYDGHIGFVAEKLGWKRYRDLGPIKKEPSPYQAPLGFKSRRPRIYEVWKDSTQLYVITVFPGEEYVNHIAALVKTIWK